MTRRYRLRKEAGFGESSRFFFLSWFLSLFFSLASFLIPPDLNAARRPLWISVELGLFRPSSATLNNELIPLLNQILSDLEAEAGELGLKTRRGPLGKINTNLSLAAEIEMPLGNQFSLVGGIGYWKKAVSASVEAWGELNNFFFWLEDVTNVSMRLIPIRVSVRGEKRWGRWRYFGGLGLTWALSQFEYTSRFQFLELSGSFEEDYFREKARGRAFLPHGEAGADYTGEEKIRFGIIIRFPIGKINYLKVVESSDPQNLGQQAVFIDQRGREKSLCWELTGLQAGLILRYLF